MTKLGFWRRMANKASDIKSGRFPVDRLPAMTDERIWKGTGGNVEEILVPSGIPSAFSSYVGDDADNRQITTDFACSLVIVTDITGGSKQLWVCQSTAFSMHMIEAGAISEATDVVLHAADGFVVDKSDANLTGRTYVYAAFGA